jgi:hypothetical protein
LKGTRHKIWIGWLAFLFIIVHFSFIIIYALPAKMVNPKLQAIATPYVEPIFTQTWGMFAPCPTVNSSIAITFYLRGGGFILGDPIANAAEKHSYLRCSHHGELVLSGANLYYWLSVDLDMMGVAFGDDFPENRMDEFYKGRSYYKIKNFIRGNALSLYGAELDSAIIRFTLEDVVVGEETVMVLPKYYFN